MAEQPTQPGAEEPKAGGQPLLSAEEMRQIAERMAREADAAEAKRQGRAKPGARTQAEGTASEISLPKPADGQQQGGEQQAEAGQQSPQAPSIDGVQTAQNGKRERVLRNARLMASGFDSVDVGTADQVNNSSDNEKAARKMEDQKFARDVEKENSKKSNEEQGEDLMAGDAGGAERLRNKRIAEQSKEANGENDTPADASDGEEDDDDEAESPQEAGAAAPTTGGANNDVSNAKHLEDGGSGSAESNDVHDKNGKHLMEGGSGSGQNNEIDQKNAKHLEEGGSETQGASDPSTNKTPQGDPKVKGPSGASSGGGGDPSGSAASKMPKPPGGLDAGASKAGGGDPIKGLVNEENVNALAKQANLTPEETKALHDAAKIAKGVAAGAEMYEGDITPDNVKDVAKALPAAKDFLQKDEAKVLKRAAPKIAKKAEEAAKSTVKKARRQILLSILVPILIFFLLFVLIIIVVLFALGGSDSDEQGASDQANGSAPQAIVQYGAPAGVTQGFMQADPSQLVGLTPELLIVLNRCGDIAPIIVTMGAGGPPGTSRYDGRSVGLSTKAVPREDVKALETCLAKAATPCTEDLLGPEPSLCISSATQPSCEVQRVAQVAATHGDILLSLTRACVPLEQRPPSSARLPSQVD